MSRSAKLFAANAIAAAGLCSAAVALSASAAAEPMLPPAVPGVPALNMIQQFATNPASVGAVLQTAATALNGASALVGAPAPNTLPVSPIEGAPGVPAMPAAPAPVAPATAPIGTAPTIGPLLSQLGVPANLVGLAPVDLPIIGSQAGLSPVAATAPVTAPVAAPLPVAPLLPALPALPVAPAPPVAPAAPVFPDGGAINPLPLLNALP